MPAERRRELRFEISPTGIQETDGGLHIRNARLLAVGTWKDSQVQSPLFYPSEVLRANAGNWVDNSCWSRHNGGVPRAITDKVGIISNQRFEEDAVLGDIYLHGRTQQSRDTIAYVHWAQEKGIPVYSSVEHIGTETWNERDHRYELTSLQFLGAAIVNNGACQSCTLPRTNEGEPDMTDETKLTELETALSAAIEKIRELEQISETQAKELAALKVPPATPQAVLKVKELEGTIASQDTKIKELELAIKKLEETPNPQGRLPIESRALEMPPAVYVDTRTGEVYQG